MSTSPYCGAGGVSVIEIVMLDCATHCKCLPLTILHTNDKLPLLPGGPSDNTASD